MVFPKKRKLEQLTNRIANNMNKYFITAVGVPRFFVE